jgi:hypothetical protein
MTLSQTVLQRSTSQMSYDYKRYKYEDRKESTNLPNVVVVVAQ